jgi:hypothetical protein
MFNTTVFQAKRGFRVMLKDIKVNPEKGRAIVIESKDGPVDLAGLPGVDQTKIPKSGDIQYAVNQGWMEPVLSKAVATPSPVNKVEGNQQSPPLPTPSEIATQVSAEEAKFVLPTPPPTTVTTIEESLKLSTPSATGPESAPTPIIIDQKAVDSEIQEKVGGESGYTEVKSTMPLSGKEGTVIIGNPMRTVGTRKADKITPEVRKKFLTIKGITGQIVSNFEKSGVMHPRDLVTYTPAQLLQFAGLPSTPTNDDLAIGWTEVSMRFSTEVDPQIPKTKKVDTAKSE